MIIENSPPVLRSAGGAPDVVAVQEALREDPWVRAANSDLYSANNRASGSRAAAGIISLCSFPLFFSGAVVSQTASDVGGFALMCSAVPLLAGAYLLWRHGEAKCGPLLEAANAALKTARDAVFERFHYPAEYRQYL